MRARMSTRPGSCCSNCSPASSRIPERLRSRSPTCMSTPWCQPPRGWFLGFPPPLDTLVALATSRDPDLRPADAGQFLRAVTEVRHGLPHRRSPWCARGGPPRARLPAAAHAASRPGRPTPRRPGRPEITPPDRRRHLDLLPPRGPGPSYGAPGGGSRGQHAEPADAGRWRAGQPYADRLHRGPGGPLRREAATPPPAPAASPGCSAGCSAGGSPTWSQDCWPSFSSGRPCGGSPWAGTPRWPRSAG